jgi:alpha-mannosidase
VTERRTVAVVPHTHWDREWYLPFQSFRLRLVGLLDDLLPHLERDPGYAHFLLDGQLAVVDDYLAVRPDAAPAIRRLVTAGRISVGPWYTLPDEFLVSGETLVRNLQLGIARAAELGGAMQVGYLPDMFGHVAQMPQLLRQFGVDHAVVWRGVPSAVDRTAFRWLSPDGSEVRAEYLPAGYGNGARVPRDADDFVAQVDDFATRYDTMIAGGPVLWMNGTDHLLPQPWLAEVVAKANAAQDRWQVEVMSLESYLRDVAPAVDAPVWEGELRSGARANLLMGVASNRVDVKQAAARAERALERLAEPACALFQPADSWPQALLDEAWLGVIRNAAHDSVCACSDDEVVDAVVHRYAEARQIGEGLADRAIAALGASVDADGPVVVNLSARTRGGVVELLLDGEEVPPGTQLLKRRPAETTLGTLPSAGFAAGMAAELEYLPRYTAARLEVDGEVVLAAERGPSGQLVSAEVRAELERLMATEDDRPCQVVVRQQPGVKVLALVEDVPGFGWAAWTPSTSRPTVPADIQDWFRLVDDGDVGDTYNWCPPVDDEPFEVPLLDAEVVEGGPLRSRVRLHHGVDDLDVVSIVERRAGEDLVRVETTVDNRRRDHRLRVHLPVPEPVERTRAECAFAVVERGTDAEGGPTELGLATYPSRRFVQAGRLTVVHEGLLEHELVAPDELAVTLLRCTGMLGAGPMRTRPLPAGPLQPLEGPQLQRRLTLRWGFAVGDGLDPYALVDDAFVPLRAVPGLPGGRRPATGAALSVEGAEVSAVRRAPSGQLEVRVFNPTGEPATARLAGRRGWLVDLLGRPVAPFEGSVALAPWRIATLLLAD